MEDVKEKLWHQKNNCFYFRHSSTIHEKLPNDVFYVRLTPQNEIYLEQRPEFSTFSHKLYDIDKDFIDHFEKTFDNTVENIGVLLNGIKGTGKSVTAKLLCEMLRQKGLPVVVVDTVFNGIVDFLSNVTQPYVIFIDEYEKVFTREKGNDTLLLTLMDGVHSTQHRRIFVLTSNLLAINENLIERPGRIRYLKEYQQMKLETIQLIVDDLLKHTHLKKDVMTFLSTLELLTIDVIISVVKEVNIHEKSPKEFMSFFNIKQKKGTYKVYEVDSNDRMTLIWEDVQTNIKTVRPGAQFQVNGSGFGKVQSKDGNIIVVEDIYSVTDKKKRFCVEELKNNKIFA